MISSSTCYMQIKMLEAEKEYECQNPRCRCRFKVKADIEQGGIMEVPV